MFTISIFPSMEYFIGLYLSLFEKKEHSLPQLKLLLNRTKNPPIAVSYTYQLLQSKPIEQYSLDIIRFISQLSDLSEGTSISQSLQSVLSQSSLLTEIRHSLTHKIQVSNEVIKICRQIILKELQEKYWGALFEKYFEAYNLNIQTIFQHYERIYGDSLAADQQNLIKSKLPKVTKDFLTQAPFYQFKKLFPLYLDSNYSEIRELFKNISGFKRSLALNICLKRFIKDVHNESICILIVKLMDNQQLINFEETFIMKTLKQLSFIHYLGYSSKILQQLPSQIQEILEQYWKNINKKLMQRQGKQIQNLYQRK